MANENGILGMELEQPKVLAPDMARNMTQAQAQKTWDNPSTKIADRNVLSSVGFKPAARVGAFGISSEVWGSAIASGITGLASWLAKREELNAKKEAIDDERRYASASITGMKG